MVPRMDASSQQLIYTTGSLLCAGAGSIHDVKARRIPNLLTGGSIAAGLLLHLVLGGWRQMGASAVAGLIAGAIFLVFFLAGGMGGGDVKLMAAVGCIVGLPELRLVMTATVFTGAILALILAAYRGRLRQTFDNLLALLAHHRRFGLTPHHEIHVGNEEMVRLPYALSITAGCLAALCALTLGHGL